MNLLLIDLLSKLDLEDSVLAVLENFRELGHIALDFSLEMVSAPHVLLYDISADEPGTTELIFDGHFVSLNSQNIKI